jgi:hypothetical protein
VRFLAERMIEDYYHVLLRHRDAVADVGLPALQELLRRTEGLEARLLAALDLYRQREAWAALLPVARPLRRRFSVRPGRAFGKSWPRRMRRLRWTTTRRTCPRPRWPSWPWLSWPPMAAGWFKVRELISKPGVRL